ncbi:hypothetical protein D1007_11485 [Hordeum vulgare]|uniref:Uncharacterized protein n=1 Tax=Hordeum vulgare subsp. vulgare TaxID=112509 RepID=A0A8I7BAT9_HORVV|nr:mucin-1-like [Hordeum vulgare subsp. vulgare]KAE8811694.1 hypothetical protein D1007_11485 [Hordeum vulgare]
MEVDATPDLTDFMNDWFFGTVGVKHNAVAAGSPAYDLTGESSSGSKKKPSSSEKKPQRAESEGGRSGGGGGSRGSSNASKQTQEWLEEAKRMMVGSGSPGRMGSPSRQVPKFAGGNGTEPSPALDRRDPMSRSARRHRQPGGIGDEILQRASIVSSPPRSDTSTPSAPPSPSPSLPPNPHSSRRKSRFHGPSGPDPSASLRRTTSSASNSPPTASAPPRPLHHRRHASASGSPAVDGFDDGVARLNAFLRRQRAALADLSSADRSSRSRPTKLVLSDASKSVSSIVAAICYAWMQSSKGDGQAAAVPVVNMRRSRMTGCRQAAWLLYHVGVDASALLFADEVDMEGLIMDQRASLVVVGQDVLRSNGEAGSVCTVLANDHSEEAYALLQSLDIKKLLLAGILLDTNNLSKMCSDKDSEAVRSLLIGTSEHKRHELFQQLMLDHNEHSFVEFLKNTYRKSSTDGAGDSPSEQKHSGTSQDAKKSNSANQKQARGNSGKPSEEAPQGKNKFSLAKFFGFGRK